MGVQGSKISCRIQKNWFRAHFFTYRAYTVLNFLLVFGDFSKITLLRVKRLAGNLCNYFLQLISGCKMPMRIVFLYIPGRGSARSSVVSALGSQLSGPGSIPGRTERVTITLSRHLCA